MATTFRYEEIHVAPKASAQHSLWGASFDVREVVAAALRLHPAHLALRLDAGAEGELNQGPPVASKTPY